MVFASRRSLRPLVCILSLSLGLCAARAEDFRISTKIYRGPKQEKAKLESETTTLFLNGVVYDFLADGSQIAVFRKQTGQPGRFILLNPEHRIQTEFTTDQLTGFIEHMRDWASRQSNDMLRFAANPQFKETFDSENNQLTLASEMLTYTVTTDAVSRPEAVAEYREFLHWYTQLNALLQGGLPPEPRLRLNEAMARRRVVPQTVELVVGTDKENTRRAEHVFNYRLSQDDMERIEEVSASLASYRKVENDKFQKVTQPAKETR